MDVTAGIEQVTQAPVEQQQTSEPTPAAQAPVAEASEAPKPLDRVNLLGEDEKAEGQDAGTDGEDSENKQEGAPEEYQDFNLPENFEVDDEAMTGFKDIAKEAGLKQDTAQKFIDLYTGLQNKLAQKAQEDFIRITHDWAAQTKADPELAGRDFDQKMAVANKALKARFDQDTIEVLKHFGIVNYPGFVKSFYKEGLQLKEGSVVTDGTQPVPSIAERMYPSMIKN